VLSEGKVVGRIFKDDGQHVTYGYIEDRTLTHGHEPDTRARDGGLPKNLAAGVIPRPSAGRSGATLLAVSGG
jgi:hypothetical protein